MAVQRDPGVLTGSAAVVDENGIAWLSLHETDGGFARLPRPTLERLHRELDGVETEAHRVRALVVRTRFSARPSPDELDELRAPDGPGEAAGRAAAGQAALRRLERLPVPTVAAISGACPGAGLELALACSYRAAASNARLALPQARLGLLPGLGATVRLPRLVGLDAAVRMIVLGESLDTERAQRLGLLDLVVAPRSLDEEVERFLLERLGRGRGGSAPRRGVARRLLEDTAPGRRVLLARAARRVEREPPPSPAAARAALESIGDGLSLPLERAFEREAELFGELAAGEAAKSLLHAGALDARSTHPHPRAEGDAESVAVLGAGERGMELAFQLARAGVAVRLKDRERGPVTAAARALRERLAADGGARRAAVEGTTGFGGFGTLDLAIAAPDAGPESALAALREAEEHVSERAILVATSPLLPLARLAAELRDPGRALGFVAPAPEELFPLLEIVAGPETRPETVAAACRLARRLGRQPLHVGDGPGFLLHRLLASLLAEATRLVEEGVGVAEVDGALEGYGFAMGPLRRIDEMGPRVAARLLLELAGALGERFRPAPVLESVARRGDRFHRYRRGRPAGPNPELPVDAAPAPGAADTARARLLLGLVNEAALALEEGVAASPADVDLAAIHGLGYPRRHGGPLYQADRAGPAAVCRELESLAATLGERFAPAPLLRRLAGEGRGFHPARPEPSGHATGEVLQ